MVISDQLNHQQQQQAIATQRLNTSLQQQQNQNHRRSSNNLTTQTNNGSNSGTCNNNCNSNNNNCNNNTNPNSTNNSGNISSNVGLVNSGLSAAAAKNQLEQLNTMREALFSQDGWGCQHVNQDTNWEVPSSPEPTNKDPSSGPPLWKPTINNGTDLWESNLRNGGQPTSQPVQKTPWGHTPSSNLGGTWGEDDDGADSNVWTGSTANPNGGTNIGVGGVGTPGVTVGPTTGQQWGGQSSVGVNVGNTGNSSNTVTAGLGGVTPGGATSSAGVNVQGVAGNGSTSNNAGNGWGDPRELRSGPIGNPLDIRNVDPRDSMRAASAGDPRDLRMLDPRDPIRGDPRGISGRLNGTSEMWGQHHQITHSQIPPALNKIVGPTGNSNVGSAVVSGGGVSVGVGVGPSVPNLNNTGNVSGNVSAQWSTSQTVVGPKDMNPVSGKQVSGWEEPSPPPQRRNIPNYDDGTSLWGQQARVPGGGSHWKDLSDPMNRNHLIRNQVLTIGNQNTSNPGVVAGIGGPSSGLGGGPTGLGASGNISVPGNPNNPMNSVGPPGRLASNVGGPSVGVGGGQHKPDNPMWVHPNSANITTRNPSWGDDGNHNVSGTSGSNWVDDKPNTNIGQISANVGSGNSWNDPSTSWNKNQNKIAGGTSWGSANANDVSDINTDWNTHAAIVGKPQQQKYGVNVGVGGINLEMIKQSKQYRILVDTGFKKDDVERALINTNMNIEEAAEILKANAAIVMENWRRPDEAIGSYPDHTNSGGGFSGRYPTPGTQPTMSFPPNNLLNNMGGSVVGVGGNNPNIPTLNTLQPLQVQKYLNQAPHNVTNTPQPINANPVTFGQNANVAAAAVNAASNSNNQPSAQQLRMLVQQIQLAVHSGYLSSQILNQPLAPATLLLLNQLLTNIKHLQGAQQSARNNANNIQLSVAIAKYKQQIQNLQSQINAQQAIYIKQQQNLQQNPQHPPSHPSGYQNTPNPQSRLNQWKLPVLEKDLGSDSTDFSRAPGTTKPTTLSTANTNNVGTLGLQSDGTWSSGRNISDGWPEPPNDNENKDWSVAQSPATTYTDLVQEFEPGKPWKGSQIKSIEDDPSITPGSVARSPLSINPTPKDADIFANASKNSPTDLPPLTLSSSTWSFNPSTNNQGFSSWSDNSQQCATAELWASPMNKTSRGPPPGLGSNKANAATVSSMTTVSNPTITSGNSNGWLVGGGNRAIHSSNSGWTGTNSGWNSNWLLLKNLNAQIDGSTLRTLCMQHGPLINFHLYLNQGIALCKYATREESSKAQMTLNNCVLGNTTICAESPSENEVQSILQHLPQTPNAVVSSSSNGSSNSNVTGAGNPNSGSGNASGNSGSNGNSGLTNNSIPSGGNNGSNINGAAVNIQGQGNNSNSTNNGGNSNNCNNSSAANTNTSAIGGNNSTWRSNQNQQNQQNQQRPTGRETDFDYISKFVCSIVDD